MAAISTFPPTGLAAQHGVAALASAAFLSLPAHLAAELLAMPQLAIREDDALCAVVRWAGVRAAAAAAAGLDVRAPTAGVLPASADVASYEDNVELPDGALRRPVRGGAGASGAPVGQTPEVTHLPAFADAVARLMRQVGGASMLVLPPWAEVAPHAAGIAAYAAPLLLALRWHAVSECMLARWALPLQLITPVQRADAVAARHARPGSVPAARARAQPPRWWTVSHPADQLFTPSSSLRGNGPRIVDRNDVEAPFGRRVVQGVSDWTTAWTKASASSRPLHPVEFAPIAAAAGVVLGAVPPCCAYCGDEPPQPLARPVRAVRLRATFRLATLGGGDAKASVGFSTLNQPENLRAVVAQANPAMYPDAGPHTLVSRRFLLRLTTGEALEFASAFGATTPSRHTPRFTPLAAGGCVTLLADLDARTMHAVFEHQPLPVLLFDNLPDTSSGWPDLRPSVQMLGAGTSVELLAFDVTYATADAAPPADGHDVLPAQPAPQPSQPQPPQPLRPQPMACD
jgi:hypothetical protein